MGGKGGRTTVIIMQLLNPCNVISHLLSALGQVKAICLVTTGFSPLTRAGNITVLSGLLSEWRVNACRSGLSLELEAVLGGRSHRRIHRNKGLQGVAYSKLPGQ